MSKGYWYLASPYTKYPDGEHWAFMDVLDLATRLSGVGITAFSPIVYTHTLLNFGKRLDDPISKWTHADWMNFDRQFFDPALGLLVPDMEGWNESLGVRMEIEWAREAGKPIYHFDCVKFDGLGALFEQEAD